MSCPILEPYILNPDNHGNGELGDRQPYIFKLRHFDALTSLKTAFYSIFPLFQTSNGTANNQGVIREAVRKDHKGTSLVVQWLRFHLPMQGAQDSIPGQGTRSHMPQLRTRNIFLKKKGPSRLQISHSPIKGPGWWQKTECTWNKSCVVRVTISRGRKQSVRSMFFTMTQQLTWVSADSIQTLPNRNTTPERISKNHETVHILIISH